ncbi:fibronectin type III domain-containing protein, partial [Candidatus Parcubacteria bacterium]|nr:fibronectin type III domain-containing protein [Candidatus Parcubacteria bacterium]
MTHNYLAKTLSVALVALFIASPFGAYAKEDGKKVSAEAKAKVEVEKKENKDDRSCLRAFGHLIAPGWIKQNGDIGLAGHCSFPFGIQKKFSGSGTTTPDTVAPVISNVAVKAELTEAVITWTTDERAKGTVFFGTSPSLNLESTSTLRVSEGGFFTGKEHRVVVKDLAASTTYHAVIRVEDKSGNKTTSAAVTFTTKSPVTAGDTAAPVISSVATVASNLSVGIGWKTNEPATSKVYYSASTPVNVSTTGTASVSSSDLTSVHFVLIPALSTSTKYYSL